jgi:hypothetical protein
MSRGLKENPFSHSSGGGGGRINDVLILGGSARQAMQ